MADSITRTRLEQDFADFHEKNPKVYELFKRFTFEAIRRGHKHFSSDAVVHRIRWETSVVTTTADVDWKINNNLTPYYARKFMQDYPMYKGFFRTRETA